jgi:hypothetical protein
MAELPCLRIRSIPKACCRKQSNLIPHRNADPELSRLLCWLLCDAIRFRQQSSLLGLPRGAASVVARIASQKMEQNSRLLPSFNRPYAYSKHMHISKNRSKSREPSLFHFPLNLNPNLPPNHLMNLSA